SDGNEVDKVSGSADGAVLTTSKEGSLTGKEEVKKLPGGKIKKKIKLCSFTIGINNETTGEIRHQNSRFEMGHTSSFDSSA
ncbi:hypothetical protein MKX01_002112, partial [Papaver californicum]